TAPLPDSTSQTQHLACHLALSGIDLPHRIAADTPQSLSAAQHRSTAQSATSECEITGLKVTSGNDQEREQVKDLAKKVPEVTNDHVEMAFVDQGYTGDPALDQAGHHGI